MRTPPSPSVMVWCICCTSAARPSARPSMAVKRHSGRLRSNGSAASTAARSNSWRSEPGAGRAMVRMCQSRSIVGVVAPLGRGQAAEAGRDPLAEPGYGVDRPLHAPAQGVDVGPAVEDGDVGEGGGRCGSFSRVHIRASRSDMRSAIECHRRSRRPYGSLVPGRGGVRQRRPAPRHRGGVDPSRDDAVRRPRARCSPWSTSATSSARRTPSPPPSSRRCWPAGRGDRPHARARGPRDGGGAAGVAPRPGAVALLDALAQAGHRHRSGLELPPAVRGARRRLGRAPRPLRCDRHRRRGRPAEAGAGHLPRRLPPARTPTRPTPSPWRTRRPASPPPRPPACR